MQIHVRMAPRDPNEPHRAATPLELFLDLAFVVAVGQAADSLHHGLVDGHVANALVGFPFIFFAVWWAWMNFAWFASAYDNDDVLYRLAIFVQMAGVLVLAVGVPRAFDKHDFVVMTAGYVVMRLALVAQWLRVAASYPAGRRTALRFVTGITLVQIGWLLRLVVTDSWLVPSFLLLAAVELAVPVWAEAAGRTSWHPRHTVERYGLFTIIVLGEAVLATTMGVQVALDADNPFTDLAPVALGGFLMVIAMWWIYFDLPTEHLVDKARHEFDAHPAAAFVWAYGYYFVFGAIAATGAGLAVAIDQAIGRTDLPSVAASSSTTIPVAIYVLAVWALHYRVKSRGPLRSVVPAVGVILVLASSFTPEPVLTCGLVMAALVVASVVLTRDHPVRTDGPHVPSRHPTRTG